MIAQQTLESDSDSDSPPALTEDLSRLKSLLEEGELHPARAMCEELKLKWPGSERVRHVAQLIAPPQTSLRAPNPDRSFEAERAWLSRHAHEYPDCWIAIKGDSVIAADRDYQTVRKAMDEHPETRDALLHFQHSNQPLSDDRSGARE